MVDPDVLLRSDSVRAVDTLEVSSASDYDPDVEVRASRLGTVGPDPSNATVLIDGGSGAITVGDRQVSMELSRDAEGNRTSSLDLRSEPNRPPTVSMDSRSREITVGADDEVSVRGATGGSDESTRPTVRVERPQAIEGARPSTTVRPGSISLRGEFSTFEFSNSDETYESVRIEAARGETPAGGSVTLYDSNENESVAIRGDRGVIQLGYSFFPWASNADGTQAGGPTAPTASASQAGVNGKLMIDDGALTNFVVVAEDGQLQITAVGRETPFMVIDPDPPSDQPGQVRLPSGWSVEDNL